ncbi:MAG: CvpA family protein [Chloroflexota bacterium]|nr:CvpA family protein [Chloroflexota bacterium]
MEGIVVWDVDKYIFMATILGLFGFIGFRRGANRELLSIIAVAVGMLLSDRLAQLFYPLVNRFHKLGQLALSGGLTSDNPAEAWQEVQKLPPLIETPADIQFLGLVIFFIIVLFFYLVGQRTIPSPYAIIMKILGMCVGVVNGFLMIYYLFPVLFPRSKAVIALPGGAVRETLMDEEVVARVVALFVFVLIIFGIYSASGARGREQS